jgi:4-hydroxy-tetrahydrodipicolinate synthase
VPGIVGLKDATGDLPRGPNCCRVPADFAVYSGNDDSALCPDGGGRPWRHFGHRQCCARPMARLCAAALAGDFVKACALNRH